MFEKSRIFICNNDDHGRCRKLFVELDTVAFKYRKQRSCLYHRSRLLERAVTDVCCNVFGKEKSLSMSRKNEATGIYQKKAIPRDLSLFVTLEKYHFVHGDGPGTGIDRDGRHIWICPRDGHVPRDFGYYLVIYHPLRDRRQVL